VADSLPGDGVRDPLTLTLAPITSAGVRLAGTLWTMRPLLCNDESNRPLYAVDIAFDPRDVLIGYILQFACWPAPY
jgi:hypothetical protein